MSGLTVVSAVAPAPSDPFLDDAIRRAIRGRESWHYTVAEIVEGYARTAAAELAYDRAQAAIAKMTPHQLRAARRAVQGQGGPEARSIPRGAPTGRRTRRRHK